jgi:hypothetical protein
MKALPVAFARPNNRLVLPKTPSALEQYATDCEPFVAVDPATRLAWWGNGG